MSKIEHILDFEADVRRSDIGSNIGSSARYETIDITHVLGPNLEDVSSQALRLIPPSNYPTLVTANSKVVVRPARRMKSNTYLASVRRRDATKLAEMVRALQGSEYRDDFAACTHPLFSQLKTTIARIQDAAEEGNSREILRQIRDSLLNRGWEIYRRKDVRDGVITILTKLVQTGHVEPEQVTHSRDILEQLGIEQVGIPLFDVEEIEVSD